MSDPDNLLLIGILPTASVNSIWRDIKVYNNYAFIVSEASNHGMQIFDLTRLRNTENIPTVLILILILQILEGLIILLLMKKLDMHTPLEIKILEEFFQEILA